MHVYFSIRKYCSCHHVRYSRDTLTMRTPGFVMQIVTFQ